MVVILMKVGFTEKRGVVEVLQCRNLRSSWDTVLGSSRVVWRSSYLISTGRVGDIFLGVEESFGVQVTCD